MKRQIGCGQKRDFSIDLLRFIGISLIILAHVSIPDDLKQVRAFDVPLMVFVSGLAYSNKSIKDVGKFYIRRFLRLVVPVYLYLSLYFAAVFILFNLVFNQNPYPLEKVVDTYLLLGGIGFVWIIRVFLIISIITPLLLPLARSKVNIFVAIIFGLLFFIFYHKITSWAFFNNTLAQEYLLYGIGYGLLFYMGLIYERLSAITKCLLIITTTFLLLGIVLHDGAFYPYASKYPPHGQYVLYGLLSSCILFSLVKKIQEWFIEVKFSPHFLELIRSVIYFISSHSIWIYLHHIGILFLSQKIIPDNWWHIQYIMVYLGAIFTMFIQFKAVTAINNRCCNTQLKRCLQYLIS